MEKKPTSMHNSYICIEPKFSVSFGGQIPFIVTVVQQE